MGHCCDDGDFFVSEPPSCMWTQDASRSLTKLCWWDHSGLITGCQHSRVHRTQPSGLEGGLRRQSRHGGGDSPGHQANEGVCSLLGSPACWCGCWQWIMSLQADTYIHFHSSTNQQIEAGSEGWYIHAFSQPSQSAYFGHSMCTCLGLSSVCVSRTFRCVRLFIMHHFNIVLRSVLTLTSNRQQYSNTLVAPWQHSVQQHQCHLHSVF